MEPVEAVPAAPAAGEPDKGHPADDRGRAGRITAIVPGLGLALALAAVATVIGHFAAVVGAPVIAIVGGIVLAILRPPPESLRPGIHFSSRAVLQASIVVFGTALSFRQVLATGTSSLPVLLGTLAVALLAAAVVGRLLHIERDLRTLIGVGTGICGASAIAATDAVISAPEVDVSYAIATIFTFNVLAVLTFPSIGRLMHLGPHSFGLWAGTAINDLSSVVAASTIFGHGATSTAVVVKLTRTLMIIPIAIGLGIWRSRTTGAKAAGTERVRLHRRLAPVLPLFIGWFLLAVTVNTLGWIPASWHGPLSDLAQFMITVALAAIGLSTRVRDIRRTGLRPLALGAVLWIVVAGTSLGLQLATGTLR
ncbi:MAG: YeiH family protein [Acidimicrobiales bacterium]